MAKEKKSDESDPPVRRQAILLGTGQRFASGLLGCAASGAGAVAVFETSNQAGSTALLLGGALGLLMALTGRVPDRIGKEGIVHEPADLATQASSEAVKEILANEDVSIDVKATVGEAVQDALRGLAWPHNERAHDAARAASELGAAGPTAPGHSTWLRTASAAALYEAKVLDVIKRTAPQGTRVLVQPPLPQAPPPGGLSRVLHPDAVIEAEDGPGEWLAIDARLSHPGWSAGHTLRALLDDSSIGGLVVVVPRNAPPRANVWPLPERTSLVGFGFIETDGRVIASQADEDLLEDALLSAWQTMIHRGQSA